tara:strand:- start:4128 stop:6350 length:2223 start_codon:yes stop_codon:yes gene_type:complete
MRISHVDINNFRKLKKCRIELGSKESVFVGANNSGKTSAMDALIMFLKKERRKDIETTDFTLSNWCEINKIGQSWQDDEDFSDLSIDGWRPFLPSIDVWLEVRDSELQYIVHLIPSLSWDGGLLGVRLSFEPKLNKERELNNLYREFIHAIHSAKKTEDSFSDGEGKKLTLWPQTLKEFLDKKLNKYFHVKGYIINKQANGNAEANNPSDYLLALDMEPFDGLFKVDIINAQRVFSDSNATEAGCSLSTQLRSYYEAHLNPSDNPSCDDAKVLLGIADAREQFDSKLESSFRSPISELEGLGYPGFSDPKITISCRVNPMDGLNHKSAVQFNLAENVAGHPPLTLPEGYNGLGYQNLISMVFKIIRFRDEWMRTGKAGEKTENNNSLIEPLHIVLIEEPEAHLHAQVQQVFIKKAYNVLRNNKLLVDDDTFTTQLIISTHSSHIAHEIDFSCLRYFRRLPEDNCGDVPCAEIINLSGTFGSTVESGKFVSRYLKATHCDIFFADAVILVEGAAERMLVPHFIKNHFNVLDSLYITVLDIGGSHAHRFRPLIEKLGLHTLIITDLDSIKTNPDGKVKPEENKGYKTSNSTLKKWLPKEENLDALLSSCSLVSDDGYIRVAYQGQISAQYKTGEGKSKIIPYTFEDALALSNIELFRTMTNTKGLLKKLCASLSENSIFDASNKMFAALQGSDRKAEMALELLCLQEPSDLSVPLYIANGLQWLEQKLKSNLEDLEASSEQN